MSDTDGERRMNCSCEFMQDQENDITDAQYYLLITTVILAILNVILIIIVIVGYFKFVAGKEKAPVGNRFSQNVGMDLRETMSEPHSRPLETLREEEGIQPPSRMNVSAKMRKRSMTFSETDEECRRHRENLADTYPTTPTTDELPEDDKRFRKKSVVTFVGVE